MQKTHAINSALIHDDNFNKLGMERDLPANHCIYQKPVANTFNGETLGNFQ